MTAEWKYENRKYESRRYKDRNGRDRSRTNRNRQSRSSENRLQKKRTGRGRFFFRFLAALLAGAILAGCAEMAGHTNAAGTETGGQADSRLQVVTTIFPQYDFARQIAGETADVSMLLKPGEEVHSYEPTPLDIKRIQNSDLFIYTGGENDVWVDSILESVGEDGPRTVRLLDLVDTYAEEHLEGMMPEKGAHAHEHGEEESSGEHEHEEAESAHAHEHEETESAHEHEEEAHTHEAEGAEPEDGTEAEAAGHSGGHVHGEEPDEHVWTAPENCVILLEKLTEEFCLADPANEAQYRKNGGVYRDAFAQLDREYREMAAAAPQNVILFGDRFPFRYLAEELGLTCYAAFPGCSAESEPSAATVAFLIDKAVQEELPVIFKIEFSNGNIAQAVCEAALLRRRKDAARLHGESEAADAGTAQLTQMQVLELHSCHNVTRDEYLSGETCLSLMRKNLEALRTALGAAGGA